MSLATSQALKRSNANFRSGSENGFQQFIFKCECMRQHNGKVSFRSRLYGVVGT